MAASSLDLAERKGECSLTFKTRAKRAGGIALLAGVALVTAMATPASAHGAGVTFGGQSNINQTAVPVGDLCLQADQRTRITLFNTGTFNTVNAVQHVAIFNATEDYYFGPGGTYSDPTCDTLTAVDGYLDVGGHNSDVNCERADATYQRVGTLYTITTTEVVECDIIGVGEPDDHESLLTYTGTQLACGTPPFGVDCEPMGQPIEFTGVYVQSGPE